MTRWFVSYQYELRRAHPFRLRYGKRRRGSCEHNDEWGQPSELPCLSLGLRTIFGQRDPGYTVHQRCHWIIGG